MNKLLLTFASLLVILVVLYFSGVLSFYTQAPLAINFNGANSLIGFDSDGNIRSVPISNVHSGINLAIKGTSDSLDEDFSRRLNDLGSKVSDNKESARSNTIGISGLNVSKADKSALSSYVKKGKKYKIYNNDNNQILLKWGSNIQSDGNTDATDDYRYFNIND